MKKIRKTEEELWEALNTFRMSHINKTFTSSEIIKELMNLGFGKNVAYNIIKKSFPFERMGNIVLYTCPKESIYKNIVIGAIQKQRDDANNYHKRKKENIQKELSEQEALKVLSSRGYQIRKCVGFDVDRFKRENPELYLKYLKYETV